MPVKINWTACLAAAWILGWVVPCMAADAATATVPAPDKAAVDKAFEALKTYDWGQSTAVLAPIDDAVVATHGDAAARKDLETRLAAVLGADVKQAAKDYACRALSVIGSAESVPALAPLLTDEKLSHMARYALERMPSTEAVAAMRDALPKAKGPVKVGIVNSLGVRRDAESVSALTPLLEDADPEMAAAAATALGAIGNAEAAKALGAFQAKAPEEVKLAAASAYLICAERLLAAGDKAQATAIYGILIGAGQPQQIRVAATRGMLAARSAGKE